MMMKAYIVDFDMASICKRALAKIIISGSIMVKTSTTCCMELRCLCTIEGLCYATIMYMLIR